MTDPVLHHYPGSPFSEKVRLVLGYKRLPWRSVIVPMVLPKPDVVALTGGYRRTPFLQIGADIYCDSALILRVLERRAPEPSIFPPSAAGSEPLAQWADTQLFWTAIPYTMQPAGLASVFGNAPPEAIKAFAADRAAMTPNLRRLSVADGRAHLETYLGWLENLLADGRSFFGGAEPGGADFSVVHPIWFIRRAPPVAALLEPHTRLAAWYERLRGRCAGPAGEKLDAAEALRIAATAGAHAPATVAAGLGFEAGEPVTVSASDYGSDPVSGTLVGLSNEEVALRRDDERAGTVVVHFPRIGFQLRREKPAA